MSARLTPTIPSVDRWGPFADDLDGAERTGRLRTLRAVVHLLIGPRGAGLAQLLRDDERDPIRLPDALKGLNALAPLDRRRVLASYAAITRPIREVPR